MQDDKGSEISCRRSVLMAQKSERAGEKVLLAQKSLSLPPVLKLCVGPGLDSTRDRERTVIYGAELVSI